MLVSPPYHPHGIMKKTKLDRVCKAPGKWSTPLLTGVPSETGGRYNFRSCFSFLTFKRVLPKSCLKPGLAQKILDTWPLKAACKWGSITRKAGSEASPQSSSSGCTSAPGSFFTMTILPGYLSPYQRVRIVIFVFFHCISLCVLRTCQAFSGCSILYRIAASNLCLALSYSILLSSSFGLSYFILSISTKTEWLHILFIQVNNHHLPVCHEAQSDK
jgi:hypothetical protein